MRTTLTIDDDVLAAAKSLARAKSQSVGRVISDLVRRALAEPSNRPRKTATGFPVFNVAEGAQPITLEDVRKDEDEV
jgi:hypothetical protein